VCKQTQPVWLTHLDEECEAQMIRAHWTVDSHLSFLSYVGMVTSLTLICLCYCCCSRCCHKRCPKFSKRWKDNNPCTTIIFKPRLVNSIHSSNESVRRSGSRANNKVRHSLTDAVEAIELVSLNTNVKDRVPSGKR